MKFRTPSLWSNLPEEYQIASLLNIFKSQMKNWKCKHAPLSYAKHLKRILVLSNCLFVCFFSFAACFIAVACFFGFPRCGENEWMNFQLVSLNGRYEQSTTNPENASHKLMKSSQRNILLLFLKYWKKVCIYIKPNKN